LASRIPSDSKPTIRELISFLESIPASPASSREEIRAEVRRLAEVFSRLRLLAKIRLKKITDARSARERALAYLKLFVGEVVDGRELQVVSAIQEFARRLRELRVEFGYNIITGNTNPDLRPDQYILLDINPSDEIATRWRIANKIRRSKVAGKNRLLMLLKERVGKPVTGDELAYVSKTVKDWPRRTRELRTQHGWRLVTRQTGRKDLPNGVYLLESLQQLPEHDRKIESDVYDSVLERDQYECRKCGWKVDDYHPNARRQFLEVHHIEHHVTGGKNNKDNLLTLCNVHHDEAHAKKLVGSEFLKWVKEV
jgi:hypothetical protein